jgi:hypothetical protein
MNLIERSRTGRVRQQASSSRVRLSVGSYLTDGTRLMRVAQRIEGGDSAVLELEDCKTREFVIWSERDLAKHGLRQVTPTATDGV